MQTLPSSERALRLYVLERNVEHFRCLATSEQDPAKRELLQSLLASAQQDLRRLISRH